MTLDYKKIIDDMATPIHEGHSCMTWEEAMMSAADVFKALQDNIEIIEPGSDCLNADVLHELKNLGR